MSQNINNQITAEEWKNRCVHLATKCAVIIGLNNDERQWMRDAGFDVKNEEDDDDD